MGLLETAQYILDEFVKNDGIAAAVEFGPHLLEAAIICTNGQRIAVNGKFAADLKTMMPREE